MPIRSILVFLALIPGVVIADAGNGEFMGYQLGRDYQRKAGTPQQVTATGNLILVADHPVKPGDIEEVSLLTTPGTLTIGRINATSWFDTEAQARTFGRRYVDLLRAKYPGWAFGREGMDADLRIVEVNFDELPYNLWLRINEDNHNGTRGWRFSMTLSWLPGTKEALAWRNQSRREHLAAQEAGRDQLLENADLRGL